MTSDGDGEGGEAGVEEKNGELHCGCHVRAEVSGEESTVHLQAATGSRGRGQGGMMMMRRARIAWRSSS